MTRKLLIPVGVWGFCLFLTFTMGVHPRDILAEKAVAVQAVEGGNPYAPIEDVSDVEGFWSHPRLPGALLLLAPLAWVADEPLVAATTTLNVTAVVLIVWLSTRLAGLSERWIISAPLLILTGPGLQSVRETNVAPLVGLAVVTTWYMSSHRDSYLAGVPLGIAATMRLFPVWMALAFLVGGRPRIAGGAAVVAAGLNVGGLLFLPSASISGTIGTLTQTTFYDWPANVSLAAVVSPGPFARLVSLAILAVLVAWLVVRRPPWNRGMVAVPVALLAGPVTWPMYLTSVIPLVPGRAFPVIAGLWLLPTFGAPLNWPLALSMIFVAWQAIARAPIPALATPTR